MPLNAGPYPPKSVTQDQLYEQFVIDRPARIILVGHHLSTNNSLRCLMHSISLYGAELDVSANIEIPDNFFLEILGIHDEIGCTLIRRDKEKVTIGFNMLINPEFLHHVIRLSFEVSH